VTVLSFVIEPGFKSLTEFETALWIKNAILYCSDDTATALDLVVQAVIKGIELIQILHSFGRLKLFGES
jgi:hypothetical protein